MANMLRRMLCNLPSAIAAARRYFATIIRMTKGLDMGSFHESMNEYRRQMEKGVIKEAYKGLMEYIMGLRTHFKTKYPDHFVSGSVYYGFMDMTYFAFTPESLKRRKLKIAIVFVHETFKFEVWLAGSNKQVQSEYWKLIKKRGWNRYHLVPATKGVDSIVESVLVDKPDFNNLGSLTEQIERSTMKFIKDVEGFLSKN
jgi:hypothetical protein